MSSLTLGKKGLAVLVLGFLALVLCRFFYSFTIPVENLGRVRRGITAGLGELESLSYNRASMSNLMELSDSFDSLQQQGKLSLLEVFEKTATLRSETEAFESDKERVFGIIKDHKAAVKYEQGRGLAPQRSLDLGIAVSVAAFDDVVAALRKVGRLGSFAVTKKDRTQEFRSLFSTKQSQEKYIEALQALRKVKGDVEHFIKLEKEILDTQKAIESLGIQLGDFAQKESFCNITFSLWERQVVIRYSLALRLFDSVAWSVACYMWVLCAAFILAAVYCSVRVLRK